MLEFAFVGLVLVAMLGAAMDFGRVFYAASTMICTPASMSQEVGLALGAQAGPARLTQVIRDAGFGRVRQATATAFNLVMEARP